MSLKDIPHANGAMVILVYSTTTGVEGEEMMGYQMVDHVDPWSTYRIDAKGRELSFYIDSSFAGKVVDRNEVSLMGEDNRGWAFGMTVGRDPTWDATIVCHPTLINSLTMRDIVYYTGEPIWQLPARGCRTRPAAPPRTCPNPGSRRFPAGVGHC